jgi:hypothetical protein
MPGEHGCDAGNLFLVVHHEVSRHVRLEVKGHLPTHPEKKTEKFTLEKVQ